ncbi:MAG: tetratricopeptide repeat protein [Cyanobacteria bacterium P01_D01_bin.115]
MSESTHNRDINVSGDVEGSQVVAGDLNQIGDDNTQINQDVAGDQNQVVGVAKSGANVINTVESGATVTIDQSTHHHVSPTPVGDLNPFGVPYQRNPYFTGRKSILVCLHQQLNQRQVAAINQVQAISGLGGIGKTQTAVEYAYRYYYDPEKKTYDYVFWVSADTEINLGADFGKLANQLCLPAANGTEEEKILAVKQWLATHDNWLLIFDNADTPDWLQDYLPTNPAGKVLITSRASIFDQLGIERPLALTVLSPDEAVKFLFRRTQAKETDANIAAATELNQELDGLPLALEQASAFMVRKRIGLTTYLNTYRRQPLSQLEKVKAKTGRYPSSVLKTWRINFDALAQENADASELLQLSAFLAPNDIPYRILINGAEHLGEALAGCLSHEDVDEARLAISDLLDLLSQYSLVNWEAGQDGYSVHRLVQAVVRNELDEATQTNSLERAILAVNSAYPGSDFKQWPICEQLLPHWLQVYQQAQRADTQSEALGRVLNQAGYYLDDQGRYSDAEPLYQEALAMRKRLLGDEHPSVAISLNNLALLYDNQGRYSDAEPLYKEALAMRKRLLGDEHPSTKVIQTNLQACVEKQNR